jgi:hypothetical protein
VAGVASRCGGPVFLCGNPARRSKKRIPATPRHWQTIFGFGTDRGLEAIRTVVARLDAHFGDRIGWIGCEALATYAAAAATITLPPEQHGDPEDGDSDVSWRVAAPFPCQDFTLSLALDHPVGAVYVGDRTLGALTPAPRSPAARICWRTGA